MPFEKSLEQAFTDLSLLSKEKVQDLVQEAIQTLLLLQEQTADSQEKQRALKTAIALQETIRAQLEMLSKAAKLDLTSFEALAENPDHFSPELWTLLTQAKQELETVCNQFKTPPKHPPKRDRSTWLPG